jgi:RNA polymerase sigma-70 factor, ECF subfamily
MANDHAEDPHGRNRFERTGKDEVSSVELVLKARGGDREAMDRLFERYIPLLRRWGSGRLPRWARGAVDTDDMIQDTLLRTLANVDTFVPRRDGALGAYLRHALNNRIRDEIRKVHGRPRKEDLRDDQVDDGASPLEEALGGEALQRYEDALGRLTEEDRELVLARIEMGMSYEQVASATRKSTPDAARMAVGRALVRLAREMDRA